MAHRLVRRPAPSEPDRIKPVPELPEIEALVRFLDERFVTMAEVEQVSA